MADLPVVTNPSPLIKLTGVGQLDLLPQLYGAIWVPAAVANEVLLRAKRSQLVPEVGTIIDRMIAQGRHICRDLRDQLLRDAGEVPHGP